LKSNCRSKDVKPMNTIPPNEGGGTNEGLHAEKEDGGGRMRTGSS
jgi:hypothetical protein